MIGPLEQYKDVWVFLERNGNALSKDSLELLAAGRKVAGALRQRLVGIILGYDLEGLPEEAIQRGADTVVVVDDNALADHFTLRILDTLDYLIRGRKPYSVIFLATEFGREIAPRLAYRLNTGLATDNIDFQVEDYFSPKLNQSFPSLMIQVRPDFGIRVAKIYTPRHRPQIATLKPGSFDPVPRDPARSGKVEWADLPFPGKQYPAVVEEIVQLPAPSADLEHAQVIIGLGLGVLRGKDGSPRDPAEAYRLAARLKELIEKKRGLRTEIGISRALFLADLDELRGLVSRDNLVARTGATVRPELYIALGISGSGEHRFAIQKSKRIIAVNPDPSAQIFQFAHYIVIGDLYEFLPKMIEQLEGLHGGP